MQEKGKQENTHSNTQIILIVGFVAVIAVICVIGYLIYSSLNKAGAEMPTVGGNSNLVIDESNLAEVEELITQAAAEGTFELNMNTIWNFPDGKSPSSDAYVANGKANSRPVSFEIMVNDTELVYSSTVIPVGSRIKEIKLDTELPAGEYSATCIYHLWNEDGTENSSFGVGIVLNIKE